jgi:tRNA pseudouridine38-40 synthase
VLRAWRVPPEFHARRSALGKRYRYRLAWGAVMPPWENLRRWQVSHSLDAGAMARGLSAIPGEHDFAAFALTGHSGRGVRGTVRVVTLAHLRVRGRRLDIVLEGDGFLRGMVRRIVGGLVEVGVAHSRLAGSGSAPRPHDGAACSTAPPHGLTLERVCTEVKSRKSRVESQGFRQRPPGGKPRRSGGPMASPTREGTCSFRL